MSDQLLYECQTENCGYQYCGRCVKLIKTLNRTNREQFYCLYCQDSPKEGAKENDLLTSLLWQKYSVKYGIDSLLITDGIPRAILNDISSRITHVRSLIQTLKKKIDNNYTISDSIQSLIDHGSTFIENLKRIKHNVDQLISTDDDDNDDELSQCFTNYLNELNGNRERPRNCEKFIEICELLLYQIQQMELKRYFPSLNGIINQLESGELTNDRFEPKAIDVFQSLEADLGRNIIPCVPCRVGLIGETSAGKTSLARALKRIQDDYATNFQTQELSNTIFSSPIGFYKSTYCQLEFEHQYDNGNRVTFVDVPGSDDGDLHKRPGNYFEQIRKADCDLYIIVFDHSFTDLHRQWQQYIVNDINRTCWIVRTKVDQLFVNIFKQDIGQDFFAASETTRKKRSETIEQRVRKLYTCDNNRRELSDIYLTFTLGENNNQDQNSCILRYAQFDLDELIIDIKNLPLSYYRDRLQKMATCATAQAINICFRRGYVLNVMKYKISAGVAAVVPFLDLVSRYFAREHIRQNLGVNTHSYLKKWWTGETDIFKDYLKGFNIEVDPSALKTSALKDTFEYRGVSSGEGAKNVCSVAAKAATGIGSAGLTVSDDSLRAVGVGGVNTIRGLSTGLIFFGVLATAGMCAWSAVSNGKQMYSYLHRLCDDLIYISGPVAKKVIERNDEIRRDFLSETNKNTS